MTIKRPEIDIVIPVYNVARYLPECLHSIREQTFANFRTILIDDGSTDESGSICDAICREDSRFIAVHQENGGMSAARNSALALLQAPYVIFIDSDDIIAPDYISTLYETALTSGADIVSSEIMEFEGEPPRPTTAGKPIAIDIVSGEEAAEMSLYQKRIDNSASGKIFRTSLWQGIEFKKGIYYEDLDIVWQIILRARKVAIIGYAGYFYRQHPSSILHKFNSHRFDALLVAEGIYKSTEENHSHLSAAAASRLVSASFNMLLLMRRYGVKNPDVRHRALQHIRRHRRRCLFNARVRLKNRLGCLLSYASFDRLI